MNKVKQSRDQLLMFAITGCEILLAAIFYKSLPNAMAIHWDAHNTADGYANRALAVAVIPIVSIFLYILFRFLPVLDSRRQNIAEFYRQFQKFALLLFLFLLYLQVLLIIWNLGVPFDLVRWLVPAFAVLVWGLANLLSRARPNWTVGIRLPWTLRDERVWQQTHEFAAGVFRFASLVVLGGLVWPAQAFWFIVGPIFAGAIAPVIYSFLLYKQRHPSRSAR